MNSAQFIELLLQSLEHERGGVKVYTTALKCAQRPDLQAEWEKYLSQTEEHVSALTELCEVFDIDPFTMTPGTQIVKALGTSLVEAMNTALAAGDPTAAQLVATECVVLAETKDHLNWVAGIGHDDDEAAAFGPGLDRDAPRSVDRVDGVGHQVHERLVEQARITIELFWRLEMQLERDAVAQAVAQDRDHRVDALANAHELAFALVEA
jgi:hypothetical protein